MLVWKGPGLAGMSCGPRRWRLLCTHRQDGHRAAHVLLAPAQALANALGKHDGAWAWPPIRLEGCRAHWNAEPARPEDLLRASSACDGTWPLLRVCHCRRDPVIEHLCPSPMSASPLARLCPVRRTCILSRSAASCILHRPTAQQRGIGAARQRSSGAARQIGSAAAGKHSSTASGQHSSTEAGQRGSVATWQQAARNGEMGASYRGRRTGSTAAQQRASGAMCYPDTASCKSSDWRFGVQVLLGSVFVRMPLCWRTRQTQGVLPCVPRRAPVGHNGISWLVVSLRDRKQRVRQVQFGGGGC